MTPLVEFKRSRRARHLRVTVRPGGAVTLVAPEGMAESVIQRFLHEKATWIGRAVEKMRTIQRIPGGVRMYRAHREEARQFVTERLTFWNAHYGYSYRRVMIKNTASLWGSCSRAGNLNFSFKVAFLPQRLADYVIVHELCHLKEHNHSVAFWRLVEKTLPDYRSLRKELRTYLLS